MFQINPQKVPILSLYIIYYDNCQCKHIVHVHWYQITLVFKIFCYDNIYVIKILKLMHEFFCPFVLQLVFNTISFMFYRK